MERIEVTYNQLILIHVVVGILVGSIPLILGLIKRNWKFGFLGFAGAVIGQLILGIFLSIPVAAIFTWLVLRNPKDAVAAADSPAWTDTDDSGSETSSDSDNS